jgi:hypothetical protein
MNKKSIACALVIVFLFLIGFFILVCLVVHDMSVSSICDIDSAKLQYISNPNIADIVITFTTMPDRMNGETFKKVLASMMQQTKRSKDIRLNIPHISKRTGKSYLVPDWLLTMPITIVRCEDFGPATKYLPTLKDFSQSNQKILVYDDDSVMPNDLVETFDKISLQYPTYCITTASYRFIEILPNKKLKRQEFASNWGWVKRLNFSNSDMFYSDPNKVTFSDVVTGWAGFLLCPNMINIDELSNYESMPASAFFVDDVVMSACLLKNGTKIMVHSDLKEAKQTFQDYIQTVFKSQTESLSSTNNKERSHDDIMEHFFIQYWQFLPK